MGGSEQPFPPEPLPDPQSSSAGGRAQWLLCVQDRAGLALTGPVHSGPEARVCPLAPPWNLRLVSLVAVLPFTQLVCLPLSLSEVNIMFKDTHKDRELRGKARE